MSSDSINPGTTESLPWYRYGMVWLVIMLPLSVVIASIFTIALAYKHAPVLVKRQIFEMPTTGQQIQGKTSPAQKAVEPIARPAEDI